MQAFLLACYLCLQLTNPSEDLTLSASLRKDASCNQCLTGLFDQSELLNRPMTQNPVLMEALEERLILELSRNAMKTRALQKEEPKQDSVIEDQVKKAQEVLTTTESALRAMQENMIEKMMKKSEEMMMQLQQQYAQLSHELNMLAPQHKEVVTKEEEVNETMENVEPEPKVPTAKRNMLRKMLNSNTKLLPGEDIVSENGRYRAMLIWNGELVIIDHHQTNRIVKRIGPSDNQTVQFEYLMLKPDGTLLIKSSNSCFADWTTETSTNSALYSHVLKLDNDGRLVVYDALNRRVWTSGFI